MKMMCLPKFLVIGLPRSRTAWLANFLTYGDSFCYHEGIDGCDSLAEYWQKVAGVGDSSTMLMLIDLPDVPKVIIERDPKFAIDYFQNRHGYDATEEMLELRRRMDKIDGLRVQFDEIDDNLREIWSHCTGQPYDERRAEQLKHMKIEEMDVMRYTYSQNLEREILEAA